MCVDVMIGLQRNFCNIILECVCEKAVNACGGVLAMGLLVALLMKYVILMCEGEKFV
jgi:hypothetical protein